MRGPGGFQGGDSTGLMEREEEILRGPFTPFQAGRWASGEGGKTPLLHLTPSPAPV